MPPGPRALARVAMGAALACACERPSVTERSRPEAANLGGHVLATVGGDAIEAELVEGIARAQGTSLAAARDRAIIDALFALGARARHPAAAVVAQRAVLSRAVLAEVERAARTAGPPTDAEVADMTRRQWLDLDRPVSVRTVHFAALPSAAAHERAARAVAERFRAAARGIGAAEAFLELGKAYASTPEVGVRAERLPPITADGRLADLENRPEAGEPTPRFDARFAAAAHAIGRVGEQSPVIESDFGWHVILLVERVPEQIVPLEERRRKLAPEIEAERASAEIERILSAQRAAHPVEVVRHADDLTSRLGGTP